MKTWSALLALTVANVLCAAEPKVGCTIAFRSGYGHQTYISNAAFKGRPIAVEMDKEGIDLCWYAGRGQDAWMKSLTQFNAIWLNTEHEDQCPYDADELGKALRAYVEAGGGLVVCHSAGRYALAPVDAYWTKVFGHFDMEILHEEILDLTETAYFPKRDLFYADTKVRHPVTDGVPGLWLPLRLSLKGDGGSEWGSVAVRYSPDWKVVFSTTKNGKSYLKNRLTNKISWDEANVGFYRNGAPLVAVRELGKGRVVFIAIHKDNAAWAYNIDRWMNRTERSVIRGKASDAVRLVENALKWVSEPSLGDPAFVTHYRPVEPPSQPYRRIEQFGDRTVEKMKWTPMPVADRTSGAKGVVGLHSSRSDGASTVAEYAAEARRLGLNFIVFTDPLASLTAENLAALSADCQAVSTDAFYACPGVEFVDLSGFEWILYHDRVEFPPDAPFLRDGRYYKVYENGVMLQPGKYRGVNLYRGAILNTENFATKGIGPDQLSWFNAAVPKAYDVDRLLHDNERVMLQNPIDLFRVAPISYTRVRKSSDLARAAAVSVTCGESLASIRMWINTGSAAGGNVASEKAHEWVRCGGSLEIRDFAFRRVPGTDVMQGAVRVVGQEGVSEVRIVDGARRTIARFDAGGAKEFAKTFVFLFDQQSYLQVIAKDPKGGLAYSTQKWLAYYHAGVNRCGDNLNLLSLNPYLCYHTNWDDQLCPGFKFLNRPKEHFQVSEAVTWEERAPSRKPGSEIGCQYSPIRLKGVDFPGEKAGMPSQRNVFKLVEPNVVAIVDNELGECIKGPTRDETHATYSFCSMPPKVGENSYWRRHHRVYQFCDRIDFWWFAVNYEVAPDYRGGYAVTEGEIEFLQDVTLAEPILLMRMTATDPVRGAPRVYRTEAASFGPGSYYAVVADETAWYGYFPLAGTDPLSVRERKDGSSLSAILSIAENGQSFRKGDKLRYRYAVGSFIEPPRGGEYLKWFAGMMDGSRFNHEAVRGKVEAVSGIVDVVAEKGAAEVTFGPTWFIQRYPVRIAGLVDNGTAYVTDGGKVWKPLAFSDGLAYAEVPLEERKTWWFGNLYVAQDKSIRMCHVPAMEGHPDATLQFLNPTDRPIRTKVVGIRSGERFEVEVPAGGCIERKVR